MINGRTVALAFTGSALFALAAFATQSSVPFIKADQVHAQGFTGEGVTVAVLDSGILSPVPPGLAGKIAAGGISYEGGEVMDGGVDPYGIGHGTYMSLIIADATGVAPGCQILPIRVTGAGGSFLPADLVSGINYVTNRRMNFDPSIRAINLSIVVPNDTFLCGCDSDGDYNPQVATAISQALMAGIVTFAGTGNEANCGAIASPACVSQAVRVAASYDGNYPTHTFVGLCTDINPVAYRITCFSNIGCDCNFLLAAPGYDINVGGFSGHGTSQATAHCSGVAALLYSKAGCDPPTAAEARSIIFTTASVHDFASPFCFLSPQPMHLDALAACNQVAASLCTPIGANPPHAANNPFQPGQPFRDVLQNTTTSLTAQGIGAGGTPDEGAIGNYAAPQVTFSGIPVPAPNPSNISVSCTGGACPTVTAVSGLGPTYTITLSGPLPVLQCTTFTFAGTAPGQKLQYKVLPGDVNLDGNVNTQDLNFFYARLNDGTANLPANWARYNIDRSHLSDQPVNTQDGLRLVQLLNGTNATQAFNGATAAACP
jgi:hypothetical protein